MAPKGRTQKGLCAVLAARFWVLRLPVWGPDEESTVIRKGKPYCRKNEFRDWVQTLASVASLLLSLAEWIARAWPR